MLLTKLGTDVGLARSWLSTISKGLEGLKSGLFAGHTQSSSTPNGENHFFMDLALCTGALSC